VERQTVGVSIISLLAGHEPPVSAVVPELEITLGYCNGSNMAGRFKTCVAILMAVLALGFWTPQPACATGTPETAKTCCCAECPASKCPIDKPCNPSCTLAQAQAFDKQLPARMVLGKSLCGGLLLFSIAPIKTKYPVFVPDIRQRDLNASPPFGEVSPQAMLRLWLI
jgi:hypothetical protein